MLYRIGTKKEMATIQSKVPERVLTEVLRDVVILDAEYGVDRDYLSWGGYSLIAETAGDVNQAIESIGLSNPCEWVTRVGHTEWISVLYLLNDDYAIVLFAPESAMPTSILNELEGQ